jgi:Papain family cysteine protease
MTTFPEQLASSLSRPTVDLRHLLSTPVRQQGPRPLCVPFSISEAHQATRVLSSAPGGQTLAVESLWQHCLNNGRADHNGTTLAAVGEAASNKGQTIEKWWPYNENLGSGTEPEPGVATMSTWFTSSIIGVPIAHDGIEDLIEDVLASGHPVVLVVEVTKEFLNPTPEGEILIPVISSPIGEYHAVLAIGASTNLDGTIRRLLIRNSWGPGWAAGGFGWLPIDYLIAFAGEGTMIAPSSLANSIII